MIDSTYSYARNAMVVAIFSLCVSAATLLIVVGNSLIAKQQQSATVHTSMSQTGTVATIDQTACRTPIPFVVTPWGLAAIIWLLAIGVWPFYWILTILDAVLRKRNL